jgi:hypothetical protein
VDRSLQQQALKMDFAKCMEILNGREQLHAEAEKNGEICDCHKSECVHRLAEAKATAESSCTRADGFNYEEMTSLELLNLFTRVQGERVETYKEYNDALIRLLDGPVDSNNGDRLIGYPLLCADMTARFSLLSRTVICIKETLMTRNINMKNIAMLLDGCQKLEKQKLELNAAFHLDIIQERFPQFGATLGTQKMPKRTRERIKEVEYLLQQKLEEIQCEKADLLN